MRRNNILAGIVLGLAGCAVNWFKLELFYDMHFLFGSILSMFALLRYGLAAGTIAALVAATCTWHHWHHPWGIVLFTAEALVAGLYAKKNRWGLMAGDILYWGSAGLLLGWFFNYRVMGFPLQSTLLLALKQGVNGIFNTVVAMGLSIALANRGSRRGEELPSVFQIIFVSLALFVLVPAMGYLSFDINRTSRRHLHRYCESTARTCDLAERSVSLWLGTHRDPATLRNLLKDIVGKRAMTITLVDRQGRVVSSTRDAPGPLSPYRLPANGSVIQLDRGVGHWVPDQRSGIPAAKRWFSSFYFKEKPLSPGNGWKVAVEASLRPQLEEISRQTLLSMGFIAFLILVFIGLSQRFASLFATSVRQLEEVTRQLPLRVASGEVVVWPTPLSREMAGLIANFQAMAAAIQRQVAERTEELEESIQFSGQVIRCAQEGVIVFDRDLRYRVWNPFMEELSGISAAEVLGRHPIEVFPFLWESDRIERLERVLAGEMVPPADVEYSVPRTGKWGWVSDLSFPLRNSEGRIVGVIVTAREISVRRRLLDELRQALDAAKNANDTMRRLLRVVAHEFRTPLGLLTGSTDILDRYWDRLTPEKRFEQNEHIRSAAQQLSNLINSVISFNLIGPDRPDSPYRLLDVGTVCRAIAAEADAVWGAGREFRVTIAADCGTALLDEMLFRRIVENLLTNAFRYTPPGGRVALGVSRERDRLFVTVSDTGIGIPEEDQALIFEAFYRSRNVEGHRGLGLGLSIVHESLQRIGGAIIVTSRVGAGTTMRVEIPAVEPER